jgi:hypothetical protein
VTKRTPRDPLTTAWLRGLILLCATPLLTACSGDVSGNVYVTTRSGDVKRGADVQVSLVRDQHVPEFTRTIEDATTAYGEATAAYQDAKTRSDQAFQAQLRGARSGWSRSTEHEEALARAGEAQRHAAAVKSEWLDRIAEIVQKAAVKATRTDVNGRYELNGVPRGKYHVVASHRVLDSNFVWVVPVDVRGAQVLDLSNSNARPWLDPSRGGAAASLPAEPPHQPKWLAEELAREKRGAEDRQETKGRWRLRQTVFKRRVSPGWTADTVLRDVQNSPEQFQSQADLAWLLSKDECLRVASRTAGEAWIRSDRRADTADGIVLIRSAREGANTTGSTRHFRVEESVSVWLWSCADASNEATDQRSATLSTPPSAPSTQR